MSDDMKKRILTPEAKAALLGDMPFSANSKYTFTPKQFLKKDEDGNFKLSEEFRPVFEITCLSRPEKNEAKKLLFKMGSEKKMLSDKENDRIFELARLHLVGLVNWFDVGTLEELPYKADPEGGCDKDYFARIPEAITAQVFLELTRISGLLDSTRMSLE